MPASQGPGSVALAGAGYVALGRGGHHKRTIVVDHLLWSLVGYCELRRRRITRVGIHTHVYFDKTF